MQRLDIAVTAFFTCNFKTVQCPNKKDVLGASNKADNVICHVK